MGFINPILADMEKLIQDIEDYHRRSGVKPQRLLRMAINAEWGRWQKWRDGSASPTLAIVDRLYAWMRDHPASGHAAIETSEDAA